MDNQTTPKQSPLLPFLVCQTLCFAAGFAGSQAAMSGLQAWYPALNKPAFTPPGWLFAPVWTVLYFLMGLALFQVWRSPSSKARTIGLWLFGVQLALNALWSWIFFSFHQLQGAFWEIIMLLATLTATILFFAKVKASAAWLLVPYLLWTCFAALLNFSIWKLNPSGTTPKDGEIRITIEDPKSGPLLPE